MSRSQADLGLTAAVAILACAAAVASAPVAVTAVLGIALLAAPGYLLSQFLLGSHIAGLESAAVATGLALCVPILGGLVLYAAGVPLHRSAWVGLLAGLTLAGDVVLFLRRRRGLAPPAFRPRPGWRLPAGHTLVFGAAAVIAVGAVGLARAGAEMQHQPGFTQLWLAHPNSGTQTADLGVVNHEGKTMQYRLVLLRNRHPAATWNLTLANGQAWHRPQQITGRSRIAIDLYRLPDLSRPYRNVAIDGDRKPRS